MKRIKQLLTYQWVEGGIILSMILITLLLLFTPNRATLAGLSSHAFEAVLLFLGSAMGFMILDRPKIMFTCLGMCAILCLYLKKTSNSSIQSLFRQADIDFSLCQILINSGADEYENISRRLLASKADILNIQELTPDWALVLSDGLSETYPYRAEMNRVDPYGMVVYSKYPILKTDTLHFRDTMVNYDIPVLKLQLDIEGRAMNFFSCHVLPRLNTTDFNRVQQFLNAVTDWVTDGDTLPKLVAGDFNLSPWDFSLQQLINSTRLHLSQREPHLFVQPFEHILYSSTIRCNKLEEVRTPGGLHLGIQGYYTFNPSGEDLGVNKNY